MDVHRMTREDFCHQKNFCCRTRTITFECPVALDELSESFLFWLDDRAEAISKGHADALAQFRRVWMYFVDGMT